MITITFFRDRKKAWIMVIVMGALVGAFLIAALVLGVMQSYKAATYAPVTAVVTDFDTRDGTNVWTEFTFQLDGQEHTVRQKGHSYWMRLGSEEALLVNTYDPQQFEVARNAGAATRVALMGAIPFGIFFALFLINYLVVISHERRMKKKAYDAQGVQYID